MSPVAIPRFSPPFVGPAYFAIQYCDEDFENQNVWNEWRLREKDRYSVHVDQKHWYEVHGLGLPFERLYFQARAQLVHATNALQNLHVERLQRSAQEFARTGRLRSI
jgi:hypothetical protein